MLTNKKAENKIFLEFLSGWTTKVIITRKLYPPKPKKRRIQPYIRAPNSKRGGKRGRPSARGRIIPIISRYFDVFSKYLDSKRMEIEFPYIASKKGIRKRTTTAYRANFEFLFEYLENKAKLIKLAKSDSEYLTAEERGKIDNFLRLVFYKETRMYEIILGKRFETIWESVPELDPLDEDLDEKEAEEKTELFLDWRENFFFEPLMHAKGRYNFGKYSSATFFTESFLISLINDIRISLSLTKDLSLGESIEKSENLFDLARTLSSELVEDYPNIANLFAEDVYVTNIVVPLLVYWYFGMELCKKLEKVLYEGKDNYFDYISDLTDRR